MPLRLTGTVSPARGRFKFKFKTNLDALSHKIERLPRSAEKGHEAAVKRLDSLWNDIRILMKIQGMAPVRPIQWVTKKQKRAFFYTKGFGRGVPTKRTNRHRLAWEVVPNQNGAVLQNKEKGARFIWGDIRGKGQSPIHAGRWPKFQEVVTSVIKKWSEGRWSTVRSAFKKAFREEFKR